ncbi:hypothetical protein ACFQO1_03510 [Jejudonia soesokkakensis]|uniref:Lipoprotein n=1 Tax=Jejudonia soesokkakensis TaxID=1323432 RepID=A0ABW2MRH9_9FLAO
MKKLLLLVLISVGIPSCSNLDDAGQIHLDFEESLSMRITLEEMRNQFPDKGFFRNAADLCFNFEYPINVGYNDGNEVTVNDFDSLLELLLQETVASHITTVAFPFNVILADSTTQTITNESEFQMLIDDCGYDFITVADVMAVVDECFTVNYPITLVVNDEEQTFTSQQEIEDYFANNTSNIVSVTFTYPLSVTLVNDTDPTIISDNFELIHLITTTCAID